MRCAKPTIAYEFEIHSVDSAADKLLKLKLDELQARNPEILHRSAKAAAQMAVASHIAVEAKLASREFQLPRLATLGEDLQVPVDRRQAY